MADADDSWQLSDAEILALLKDRAGLGALARIARSLRLDFWPGRTQAEVMGKLKALTGANDKRPAATRRRWLAQLDELRIHLGNQPDLDDAFSAIAVAIGGDKLAPRDADEVERSYLTAPDSQLSEADVTALVQGDVSDDLLQRVIAATQCDVTVALAVAGKRYRHLVSASKDADFLKAVIPLFNSFAILDTRTKTAAVKRAPKTVVTQKHQVTTEVGVVSGVRKRQAQEDLLRRPASPVSRNHEGTIGTDRPRPASMPPRPVPGSL